MQVKGRFDHFNINVTNLERVSSFMKQHWGCTNHTARKQATVRSFWYTWQTTIQTFAGTDMAA